MLFRSFTAAAFLREIEGYADTDADRLRANHIAFLEAVCPVADEFGVTQERHDWAWNEQGICYYCAHCCLALEKRPAERWGHPVRVVDPPIWGGSAEAASTRKRCSWTVYRSLEAIPEAAYERIGMKKPALPVIGPGGPAVTEGNDARRP